MIHLHHITFENNGRKIVYDYSYDAAISKFFKAKQPFFSEYDTDVSQVPMSIAVIPFLANFAPIAWFAGFDIAVPETDADFVKALASIRNEFAKYQLQMANLKSELKTTAVQNQIKGNKSVMLFSGGVDAFTTYFRHFDENPDLVTLHGADIELSDQKQWQEVKNFNENESILKHNSKNYITTNLHDFYTHEVDLLLPTLGWWGNVQHGLALIASLAPLSWINGYGKIYIASTQSVTMEFTRWGSMPETDEKISWAGIAVVHDGFELKRQDKVDFIVDSLRRIKTKTTIRVCFSELKTALNCSNCEKCIRTMFGILLAGGNPNDYGFIADISLYDKVESAVNKGFKTPGTRFYWSEIFEKSKNNADFFVFSNFASENEKMQQLSEIIGKSIEKKLVRPGKLHKIKLRLIKNNPKLFAKYLQFRRKF